MKKEPLFFTDKTEIGAQHVPIDNTKFDEGGQLFPSTEKLIEELIKNSDYSVSEIMTNKDGEKYRYHHWKLKYKSASNWLVKLFEKASTENTGKFYNTNFAYGDYSFYYDRPTLKNRPNGSMSMKKLEVIETLEKGGLIAPNGQPSGLYFTEIYNLVRTPEFKAWFGDWEEAYRTKNYDGVSKIIDENGEPLICVHNTPNEFTVFDRNSVGSTTDGGFYGKGFYFTPNVGQQRYGEIELNCFLNIKNPYLKQESHRSYELNTEDLESNGYDGVVVYPSWVEEFELESGVANCQEIVAYYPEQIKLGDGKNTTFDTYSDDIRFEKGGQLKRISAGFYKGVYKGVEYEIINIPEQKVWYWKVGNEGGDDWYNYKKTAIQSVKLWIDENELKMEKGGLIAPNGRKSNLTPEQYKLVRTYAFKKWFGDWENDPENASKVIDENGEPLVVYREIEPHMTKYYNTELENALRSIKWETNLSEILSVKLPTQSKIGDKVSNGEKTGVLTDINDGIYTIKYEDNTVSSSTAFGLTFYGEAKHKNILTAFLNIRILGGHLEALSHSFANKRDSGLLYEGSSGKTFFTFRSYQAKLADGRNTTFDPTNPDIRFKHGGSIENERIVCENCGWSWKVEDGGDDLYECHKCDHDNTPNSANKFASGGGIDINEPFDVNGKTLAERVRILVKQLYPDYKWSITSSYKTLDVYLLEADFDPFTEKWKQEHPDRLYYTVDFPDLNEYNRQNNANITDRAVEVFKPIREYIDKFVYNRNADDPYADYSDYNVYEYTYIGKWDKPYKQVEPKAGKKKAKAPAPVTTTPTAPQVPFKKGDILAISQDKLNRITGLFAKRVASEIYFEVSKSISPFAQQLIKYDDQNNSEVIVVETNEILDDYVKATAPLFKTGDTVVNKLFPNNPLKIKHRAYYQQTAVKYASLEKKFLLSGMYWNYELENGTFANEGELELYDKATPSSPAPDLLFTIENVVAKTTFSEGLKKSLINDFYNSDLKYVVPLIGKNKQETSKNIENNVAGFSSGKNTYLQANRLAEEIHKLVDFVNAVTASTSIVSANSTMIGTTQFEIWNKDLGNMTWEEATKKAQELGEGWRLPTLKELEYLCVGEGVKQKINLADTFYWSSDVEEQGKSSYWFGMTYGQYGYEENNSTFTVRPVRDITATSLSTPENTFLEYLKQNNDNAGAVPQALEVTSSLALFIMASKDVENLDSKKYSELMDELLKPFTKKD